MKCFVFCLSSADKMGIKTTVHEIIATKQNMTIPAPVTHADFLKCEYFNTFECELQGWDMTAKFPFNCCVLPQQADNKRMNVDVCRWSIDERAVVYCCSCWMFSHQEVGSSRASLNASACICINNMESPLVFNVSACLNLSYWNETIGLMSGHSYKLWRVRF